MAQAALKQVENLTKAYENLKSVTEVDVAQTPKKVVWNDGKVKLWHFTPQKKATVKTPVLVVYALVNRWYMMDIQPDRSFIGKLLAEGLDVYLLDTGYPTIAERYKTVNDYINGNINDCVDFLCEKHHLKAINLMGICQGGTFSAIYAALHPEKVKNLVTLVTPIDFATNDGLLFKWSRCLDIDNMVDKYNGIIPGSFLNTGFDLLIPMNKVRKLVNLAQTTSDKDKMMNFLRMEHWINESPDQAGETYRQFIIDMYQHNKLVKGEFELDGEKVNLKNINMPLLTIYASEDHIVPPQCTKPLNDLVSSADKELYEFPGGHIGVFVGARSQTTLAPAIEKWFAKRDDHSNNN